MSSLTIYSWRGTVSGTVLETENIIIRTSPPHRHTHTYSQEQQKPQQTKRAYQKARIWKIKFNYHSDTPKAMKTVAFVNAILITFLSLTEIQKNFLIFLFCKWFSGKHHHPFGFKIFLPLFSNSYPQGI